ncbi:hypothetical protein BPMI_01384 [Candidatus Burkholderia pumila]|uniref:Uncharacterized protein n=1 Tax=Candidatus Burkholderia pumila TaxID=1090375 RepID=A0ABR5HK04_9BURK|nr:hypothetical protein BPMI_01384 [Candidatus Burkholderia pumila]
MDELRLDEMTSHASHLSNSDSKHIESGQSHTNHETPSLLPGAIANAIVRAYEGLNEFNLTESARRVLACLVRFGLKLNEMNAAAFIKKSTIAKKLGINPATVYRALEALETAGIIYRTAQPAVMSISTICFTQAGLTALGLIDPTKRGGENHITQSSTVALVRYINSEPKQSFSKRHCEPIEKNNAKPTSLPPDLVWLAQEGHVSPYGIFALMRMAREKGHRLSDVVQHARDYLRSSRIANTFAYLRTMLSKPIDYRLLVDQAESIVQSNAAQALERQRVDDQIDRVRAYRGQSYMTDEGEVWTIEETSLLRRGSDGRFSSTPFRQAIPVITKILDGTFKMTSRDCYIAEGVVQSVSSGTRHGKTSSKDARVILAGLRLSLLARG